MHEVTLIPAPKLHAGPVKKLLPVSVTLRLVCDCLPEIGVAPLNVGAGAVVTVIVRVTGLGSVMPALSVTVSEAV